MRRTLSDQAGMTLIEVLVAVVILAVGIIPLVSTFDATRKLGTSAEAHQTAEAIAQGDLQRIEALPWSAIALTAEPAMNSGATSTDPTYYEQSGSCVGGPTPVTTPCYKWDWDGSSAAEPLVISGSADTTADPSSWSTTISTTNGAVRLSGKIYRFITWVNDPKCTLSTCGGSTDYKRVLVAVTGTGLDTPVVLTTFVTNPVAGTADPLYNGANNCLDSGQPVACIG